MKNIYVLILKSRAVPACIFTVFLIAFIALSNIAQAENIISSGTSLKVLAGTSLVSTESLTIKSGAILDNAGTVILKKDLTNQNASANSLGTGTLVLSGTVVQALNGPNVIQNLTINNAAGVTNGGDNRVNGVLTLSSGLVTLGANNFTLGTGVTVAGAPSATAMLVPTGAGEVRKSFSGIGSFLFPVGDNTTTAEYSPVTLAFTAGTFGSGNYAGVKLVNAQYPGSPVAGSFVKRYWDVSQSGITGFTCNSTFKYVPADVIGTESLIYCVRVFPTVNYFNATNTATDQLTANGLTSFGSFTGYQQLADKNLNLTLFLEGFYTGPGTMRKAQGASGNQFPGTTADQFTVELHSAASYPTIAYTVNNVNLSTTGGCTALIPGILSGSYYVTIKHRNSIVTTTAAPVVFTGSPVAYSFASAATQAFGNNLKAMGGGFFALYGGDPSQDGFVDGTDMALIDNASTALMTGYHVEDLTGDGFVDGTDMAVIDNNSTATVHAILP